jgi:hypothetical protein
MSDVHIELPFRGGPSNLALDKMLAHTQSLRSLTLDSKGILLEDMAVAAIRSGSKKNTALRELTLDFPRVATSVSPILTSLRDHPLLQRLYLCGRTVDLAGLETVLLSDTSKITELYIHRPYEGPPVLGLHNVLRAVARRPTFTKLGLRCFCLGRDETRLFRMSLRNTSSLRTHVLTYCTLGRLSWRNMHRRCTATRASKCLICQTTF